MVQMTEMTLQDVLRFLDLMASIRVRVWLDGGWAVDACLGSQTRPHRDLDIEIEERDLATAISWLGNGGFNPIPRDDTQPWNFVLGDVHGREIDFHVIVLDEQGNGIYGPPETDFTFPAEALAGSGRLGGRTVACLSPEWLVRFHTGYEPDEDDWADVSALCERFGLPIPEGYGSFR